MGIIFAERSSAGTAGAGASVETGWRVKVTDSMADRAAPAVVQPRLVRRWFTISYGHGFALIRLFFGWCSSSQRPSASINGGT
jgi:hypothetical protein